MKSTTLAVVAIVVILIVGVFLSYSDTLNSNNSTLDQATPTIPPIPNVKITNFIYLGNWHGTTLGGLLDLFSLRYNNLGIIDVVNLTVTLNTSKTNAKDKDPT